MGQESKNNKNEIVIKFIYNDQGVHYVSAVAGCFQSDQEKCLLYYSNHQTVFFSHCNSQFKKPQIQIGIRLVKTNNKKC